MARIITKKSKTEEKKEKSFGRLVALLVLIILLMVVMVIIPLVERQQARAEAYACNVAMKKAQDVLIAEFLADPEMTLSEATVVVDRSKLAMDSLCPADGDFYLLPEKGSWHIICGIHESNTKLRTRTNATRVFEMLEEQVNSAVESGRRMLETTFIWQINGKPLEVIRLEGNNGLRRGTDYSIDFDGVVCFFSLNAEGRLHWFVYADANHAAVWKEGEDWSGDAYTKS